MGAADIKSASKSSSNLKCNCQNTFMSIDFMHFLRNKMYYMKMIEDKRHSQNLN